MEFSSITNIVKYFKDQGIIMDRNKIAKVLNTGEDYKGYIFALPPGQQQKITKGRLIIEIVQRLLLVHL
jgi:hypothetical protein